MIINIIIYTIIIIITIAINYYHHDHCCCCLHEYVNSLSYKHAAQRSSRGAAHLNWKDEHHDVNIVSSTWLISVTSSLPIMEHGTAGAPGQVELIMQRHFTEAWSLFEFYKKTDEWYAHV